MVASPSLSPPRNEGIDLLRGLSILLVVLHHLAIRFPLKDGVLAEVLPRSLISALLFNGYEAVFVFFVISGFLITTHALQRWGPLRQMDWRAFYIRRATRILPTLALIVAVLAALHLLGVEYFVIDTARQSLGRALLSVFGLHLNWYEGQTGYLPGGWDVLWSLSIEETFYLAFPLLCLAVRDVRLLGALMLVFALSLPITRAALDGSEIWQEKAYLPGMAAIAAGVFGALLANAWRTPSRAGMVALAALGAIGLASALLAGVWWWNLLRNGYVLVLTLSTMCLVIALHVEARTHGRTHLRGTGWLASMGRLSYEMYLTHMFVVFATVKLFAAFDGDMYTAVVWYLPAVLACWALGAALAHGFSIPVERRLRRRWLPR